MQKNFIICLFIVNFSNLVYSQDSLNYKSKWLTRLNYGVNVPITKLLDGRITDNLIEYEDNSSYWQALSILCFFNKNWGVEFNFQGMTSGNISKKANNFSSDIKSDYENLYYVTASTGAIYFDCNPISGNFVRGLVGLIYKYEKNRLFLYPKFSIGVNSFSTAWGKAILKQKNSNNLLEVSLDSDKRHNDNFTIATSLAFGYKLSKRTYLNFDLMASHYKTDITFTKKITDLNTMNSKIDNMHYKKDIITLSIGGGIIFEIK